MSTPENKAPLLQVRGLTKEFRQGRDRVLAVHGMDLEIQRGEVFGLVGESGCGKSTFGQMLVHLVDPTGGKILLEGEDITHPARSRRKELCRRLQIVFQDPYSSIDPNKTIGWLVEEPLRIHGICKTQKERDEKVNEVLRAVGLDESYRTRWPNELSGGQRQRVAIAIALILNPDFVVCDEPVSALDVSVQAQVLNLLLKLRQEFGLTYLFISHDLNVVSYMSDRIGVMYLGGLVELGSGEAISQMPLHPYTQALFSASMDVEGDRDRIILSGDLPSPAHPPAGCPFHTRCFACTDRCKTEKPQLREFEGGRFCACHLVEQRTGLKPVAETKALEANSQ
ncbi:MAG: ABC transporter ATP-binding protein [Acutalibacter sp.]